MFYCQQILIFHSTASTVYHTKYAKSGIKISVVYVVPKAGDLIFTDACRAGCLICNSGKITRITILQDFSVPFYTTFHTALYISSCDGDIINDFA